LRPYCSLLSEILNPESVEGTVRKWLAYRDDWPHRGHVGR
jgi:hypothetical protein